MSHQFFFNPYILDNLPAPMSGFDVVQDLSEPRLRMYITSRGVKSFFVRRRINGRDQRIIIGNYPDVDIETARDQVPVVLATAAQPKPVRRTKVSFKKITDMYLVKKVRRGEDSHQKLVRAINRHLAGLFEKNVGDITTRDVAQTLENISGAAIRNRMHELMNSIFKFAMDEGYATENPANNIEKIKEKRRTRPLNRAGLDRLVNAIKKEESQNVRAAFLMLIYGFAPKSKIFSMRWRDLDFNQYAWNNQPLSDAAVVLLTDLPQNGRWVFPGRGGNHLTDPRVAWKRVTAAARIPNLTMDDVYKFLNRTLVWAPDREDLRRNMNRLIEQLIMDN